VRDPWGARGPVRRPVHCALERPHSGGAAQGSASRGPQSRCGGDALSGEHLPHNGHDGGVHSEIGADQADNGRSQRPSGYHHLRRQEGARGMIGD